MGMAGMDTPAMQAYADAGAAKAEANARSSKRNTTVAEFRNRINPTTKYYDNYNAISFWMDDAISSKVKFAALFGDAVADAIDRRIGADAFKAELDAEVEELRG